MWCIKLESMTLSALFTETHCSFINKSSSMVWWMMMTWEYLCDTINIELFNFQLKYASCDIYNKPT